MIVKKNKNHKIVISKNITDMKTLLFIKLYFDLASVRKQCESRVQWSHYLFFSQYVNSFLLEQFPNTCQSIKRFPFT